MITYNTSIKVFSYICYKFDWHLQESKFLFALQIQNLPALLWKYPTKLILGQLLKSDL